MNIIVKTLLLSLLVIPAMSISAAEQKVPKTQVVALPVKTDPTISFRLWFKVGSQDDPPGKEGLSALTAAMLADASTQKNSYAKILQQLFPLAAAYDSSVSTEMTVVSGRVHKDNLEQYYPLLTEAVLQPAFAADDLERIRDEMLNYLQNTLRYASDEELGKAVLYNQIFAGTPYGHISAGLIESVKKLTPDDVRAFYRKHYNRENVVVGIGGGYDAALVDRLCKDLGRLPEGEPAVMPPPKPQPIKGFKVAIVEKDAPATAISMGYPIDVLRGDKDWYALAVANSWLGQHRNSSSHLYQIIREARGLNYGDYSYIERFPNGGQLEVPPVNVGLRQQIFEIWIRPVPHAARHFALRAALREYQHLVENGMTAEDFDLTRRFLKSFVLQYAPTTMARLGYALDDRYLIFDRLLPDLRSLPGAVRPGHLETFRNKMDTLTLQDVNSAIKRHWQYGNMQIAIVTKDAAALKEALVADAPSPIKYATPKPESVLKEDEQIAKFPLKIKAEDVKIVPVDDLFVK
jgi:zinc protease